jgi:hypothetical protein
MKPLTDNDKQLISLVKAHLQQLAPLGYKADEAILRVSSNSLRFLLSHGNLNRACSDGVSTKRAQTVPVGVPVNGQIVPTACRRICRFAK